MACINAFYYVSLLYVSALIGNIQTLILWMCMSEEDFCYHSEPSCSQSGSRHGETMEKKLGVNMYNTTCLKAQQVQIYVAVKSRWVLRISVIATLAMNTFKGAQSYKYTHHKSQWQNKDVQDDVEREKKKKAYHSASDFLKVNGQYRPPHEGHSSCVLLILSQLS